MTKLCDDCGLPGSVCSGIALACMAVAESQGLRPLDGINLYRDAIEGAFKEVFNISQNDT